MKKRRVPADKNFPIVEAFGYDVAARGAGARRARDQKWCPFADTACEKFRQYGYGYCSVSYAAADDDGVRRTYAVCDHRLDGVPVAKTAGDHFGAMDNLRIVPEIVLTTPRTSFDYVAIKVSEGEIVDVISIETQAIDIRGGGVGPAWKAWFDGKQAEWRKSFTVEALAKKRKDNVAYGVNMANIYKRLGLQVVEKGSFLKRIGVPLYVVMQDLPYQYLRRRIPFEPIVQGEAWDIAFMTFEYSDHVDGDGSLEFTHRQIVRTTLGSYAAALSGGSSAESVDRAEFLGRIKRKAGLGE